MNKRLRAGFTLVELLVVIAIIGVMVGLLLPAVQAAREAARRMSCSNNVKQLALAMHNYHDTFNSFPAAAIWKREPSGATPATLPPENGRDAGWGATWVVMLLPFIEQGNLADQYDPTVPARHANNATVNLTRLAPMLCPSQPPTTNLTQDHNGFAKGHYAGNAGAGRLLMRADANSSTLAGMFSVFHERGIQFRDAVDGTSNVALVGEIVTQSHTEDDRGAWGWCSGPLFTGGSGANCTVVGAAATAAHTPNSRTMMDCSPYSSNNQTDVRFNIRSNPDRANTGSVAARSYHPGGVMIGLADGSVRFVNESIDRQIYWNFLARADGNPVQLD